MTDTVVDSLSTMRIYDTAKVPAIPDTDTVMTGHDHHNCEHNEADPHRQNSPEPVIMDVQEPTDIDEEDSDLDPFTDSGPKRLSDRRRMQYAVVDSYVESYMKENLVKPQPVACGEEDSHSMEYMIKQIELDQIIASPREYQVELFERAKESNVIAVLDTGSGKTLIAVLLLRHTIAQELEDRARGHEKRISFFLVQSVTLLLQQHAVLERNLDQPMIRAHGKMATQSWTEEIWQTHFNQNMIILCTADILQHCLAKSFIKIEQINLLIFDEAHHTKKNHVYATIIKEYYARAQDKSRLPKIFGMTASPVDARTDVKQAAAELESLLHSQIVTASDPSLLQYRSSGKIVEQIATYPQLQPPYETPLCLKMRLGFGSNPVLVKTLRYAKYAASELGAWCADHVWALHLAEERKPMLEAKLQGKFSRKNSEPLCVLESHIVELQHAQDDIKKHSFQQPTPCLDQASGKVLVLHAYLSEVFERPTTDKCIVFVSQRKTARLLAELFSQPGFGTNHLRVGSLTGSNKDDSGETSVSFRQQVITMTRFRNGALNCLFATTVAEEGLDIPDCNLIIRFDLYTTLIQYIQSRGRARQANSRYIHMMEEDNRNHLAIIREVRKNESILRQFCLALPADRLLTGNDFDMDHFLAKEKKHRRYTDPETGAILTYRLSLMVLANFVSSLPHGAESVMSPEYVMTAQNKMFVCEVILPTNSPVRGAVGRVSSTKQVAKCSAAFEACLLLRQGNHIDARFRSTYAKQLPAMRNALLAVNSKRKQAYSMRTKPEFWSMLGLPSQLHLSLLLLDDPDQLGRSSQPLGLLTRERLPSLPQFPLFFGHARSSKVRILGLSEPITPDTAILEQINSFTLRIFDDVFSKEYESDVSNIPYFLVPLESGKVFSEHMHASEAIAWQILKEGSERWSVQWDDNCLEEHLADRYIVDPFDGSRKFWSVKVSHEYKPLDPVPPNTAPRPGPRKKNSNIMEYSCSLWSKARSRRTFREDQPVVEAELISLRRNLLDDSAMVEPTTPKTCFLILEPLLVSALPTTVVAMAYVFPAIIHRIDSYLIALEACQSIDLDIQPDLALEALTKDAENSGEHGEDQVNFQRGMGRNYERLEFLGDSFLKMATSISLYTRYPDSNEFDFHVMRMLLICNKNLFNNACNLKLYEYIRLHSFNRRAWYPEGLILKKGKAASAQNTHELGDKTIADVAEALIGAALLSHNTADGRGFDNAVRAVSKLVCSEDHDMMSYDEYFKAYNTPAYQIAEATASHKDLAVQVQDKHAYRFKHPRLLRSAFMHPSYPYTYEHVPNYQRLEFLGDALLDMASINFLFHKFPAQDPQWLTEHKMAMVSNQFLGALCVALGFHKHLLQFNGQLQKQINDYVDHIETARQGSEQDAIDQGKASEDCSPDYWINGMSPPKCLPDIVEAYVGAIFIDSEYDFQEVERFFAEHVLWFFGDISLYDGFANKQPVTFLSNFLDVNMGCHDWNIFARPLPDLGHGTNQRIIATLIVHSSIVTSKEGSSSRYTKISVAKQAMEMLVGLSLPEFRRVYKCDCQNGSSDAEGHGNGDSVTDRIGVMAG